MLSISILPLWAYDRCYLMSMITANYYHLITTIIEVIDHVHNMWRFATGLIEGN